MHVPSTPFVYEIESEQEFSVAYQDSLTNPNNYGVVFRQRIDDLEEPLSNSELISAAADLAIINSLGNLLNVPLRLKDSRKMTFQKNPLLLNKEKSAYPDSPLHIDRQYRTNVANSYRFTSRLVDPKKIVPGPVIWTALSGETEVVLAKDGCDQHLSGWVTKHPDEGYLIIDDFTPDALEFYKNHNTSPIAVNLFPGDSLIFANAGYQSDEPSRPSSPPVLHRFNTISELRTSHIVEPYYTYE